MSFDVISLSGYSLRIEKYRGLRFFKQKLLIHVFIELALKKPNVFSFSKISK